MTNRSNNILSVLLIAAAWVIAIGLACAVYCKVRILLHK